MKLNLHANATTTPKTRAYIQKSQASAAELAAELGVSEKTVRRWRARTTTQDRSHRPKRLAVSLTQTEENLVVELRQSLDLSLDDIVEVMRRCCKPTFMQCSWNAAFACAQITACWQCNLGCSLEHTRSFEAISGTRLRS
jgi:hypothetical protein